MINVSRDSALTGGVGSPEMTDVERRVSDVVRHGTVVEADYSKSPARLRVGIGDPDDAEGYIKTGWLPMKTGRSDEWNPLKVGESVTVIAEGGELQNGVVLPGSITNEDHPNVGDRADLYRKRFGDGGEIEYDETSGTLAFKGAQKATVTVGDATITVQDGSIVLTAGGQTFTVGGAGATSSGRIRGDDGLEVTGAPFTHNGKNVGDDHHHSDVEPGSGTTGDPV